MSKITYSEQHVVRLDGKQVGIIKAVYNSDLGPTLDGPRHIVGYRYWPNGSGGDVRRAGDIYPMLAACKHSLEDEPTSDDAAPERIIYLYPMDHPCAGQVVLPQPAQGIDPKGFIALPRGTVEQWRTLSRTPANDFKRYAGTAAALYLINHP